MSDALTTNPDGSISRATLTQWLADARIAYHQLITGGKAVTLSYEQGLGKKAVTYTAANISDLNAYIASLERDLGMRSRRAIGVKYHGGQAGWPLWR